MKPTSAWYDFPPDGSDADQIIKQSDLCMNWWATIF
jgi:hypothetical protein